MDEVLDPSLEWNRFNGKWQCPYQEYVECYHRDCPACGWHPVVAKARLCKFKAQQEVAKMEGDGND